MDFGRLLAQSGRLLWQHKFMWALGILPGITHVVGALLQHWLTDYLRQDLIPIFTSTSPEEILFADDQTGGEEGQA